jgi:hypothetical protein
LQGAGKIKILVSIPNYGTEQIHYLKKVVEEFKKFDSSFYVDIIIHSNVPIPINDIEVNIVKHLDDWWKLPFIARKTIYERKDDYDLFIYNENDQLITQSNVECFFEASSFVPPGFLVGFFRYENGNNTRYYPEYHNPYTWKKSSVFNCGPYVFAQFTNHHQGCFVLTKNQLAAVVKNIDFLRENKLSKYRRAERVGADIYYVAGFTKLVCISHFDKFLIHHLPDKYLSFGKSDAIVRNEINQMLNQKSDDGRMSGKIYCINAFMERVYDRLFFQNRILGKIRRECYDALKNISKMVRLHK